MSIRCASKLFGYYARHATHTSRGVRTRYARAPGETLGHAAEPVPLPCQPSAPGRRLERFLPGVAARHAHAARAARARHPARRAAHALRVRVGPAPEDGAQGGRARGADRLSFELEI